MKKIDYCDTEEIRSYIEKYGYNEYNCNVVTLLMWKDVYELYYEIHEHYFVGYWLYHNRIRWMMPLCEDRYFKEAIDFMLTYSKEHGFDFVIEAAVEPFVDKLRKEYNKASYICRLEDNAGDYVYDLNMHASLQGKKMQKRRNHYNAFMKEYENRFEYCDYNDDLKTDVLIFLNRWMENHDRKEDIAAELAGITELLEHFDKLELMAGCIYIDGNLEAFTMASKLSKDTLQIHVEKANREIRGLYVAILKYFLNQHLNYLYINREDDLGIPELRKAKMDLHPLYRLKKYAIGLNEANIIHPNELHKQEVRNLWLECFNDETENSTDFYFNHLYSSQYTYAIECHNKILAAMQIKPMLLNVAGKSIKTHFIVGVCTKYNFRGNGFMRQMMDKALAEHQEDQILLLQAYNWDIYKSFHFEIVYYHNIFTIKEKFNVLNGIVYNYKGEARVDEMLESYQTFVSHYDGYRLRDVAYYNDYFIPYHQNEGNQILMIYNDSQICLGYLIYSLEADKMVILETIVSDLNVLQCTINYLLDNTSCIVIRTAQDILLNDNPEVVPNMAIRYQSNEIKNKIDDSKLFISEIL